MTAGAAGIMFKYKAEKAKYLSLHFMSPVAGRVTFPLFKLYLRI